jgi:hypothetical protein
MQDDEKKTVLAFTKEFWADPENQERFRNAALSVGEDVDSLLSRGNVALMNRCVTTAEQSKERRVAVGLPIFEFEENH